MTDGLKDVHRDAIIAAIAANDRVERAVLFGSRATETNTVSSDVDIAVFGERLTLTDQARLAAALDEIPIAQSVDLLLYASIESRTLREHIRREGVEWYARRHRDDARDAASGSPGLLDCLPPGWERSTLGAACERGGGNIQTGPFGSQLHASDYRPVGIPSVMPQNLGDNRVIEYGIARIGERDASRLARYLVRTGDIVYSRKGDVGRRALIGPREDGWLCGTGCLRVRLGDNGVDPRYASYYLGHPVVREWIVRHAHGATMPNLNTAILSACPFLIPPVPEQRGIAHVLGTLDDKIELNRRMNTTLEAMARALFRSWFVDFDPVRAKMAGGDTGLPTDVADLFPDRLVDSELGGIPEGWMHGTLADIVSLNPESWGTGDPPQSVAYVDLTNTKWGYIERVEVYPWEEAPSRARRVLRKGDTIVATVRPGNGSFALIDEDGLTGSTGFAVLRPRRVHDRELVWCAVTSSNSIDRLAYLADGGAYPAVRPGAVLATSVVLAGCRARKAFASSTAALLDRIETNKRASRALTFLRDGLLPRLVSGELRVAVANRPYGDQSNG